MEENTKKSSSWPLGMIIFDSYKNLKEIQKRERFLKYAKDKNLCDLFDSNISSKELHMNTKCYKYGYSDEYCEGWYTNQKRCMCGIKWYLDYAIFDAEIWERIDLIDSVQPLGYPEKA